MAEMKRIRLADMRPDPNNPRKDFNGIEELSDSFAFTPGRPGEPVNPPIVVEDGNVFRIVDGERRYRAMCKNGTEDGMCLCLVFDDFSDASSVSAMMATDDKESLTEREKCIGVQQMLILGVPDETADKLSRSKTGTSAKVRKAIGGSSTPIQLSMRELLDVAKIDDESKRSELLKLAGDGNTGYGSRFHSKLRYYEGEQRARKERDGFVKAFSDIGVEPLECAPDPEEWAGRATAWSIDSIGKTIDGIEESGREWCVFLKPISEPKNESMYWGSVFAEFYVRREEDGTASCYDERLERMRAFDDSFIETRGNRIAFIYGMLEDGSISDDSGAFDRRDLRDFMSNGVGRFFADNWYIFDDAIDKGSDEYRAACNPDIKSFEAWQLPLIFVYLEPDDHYLFSICTDGASASECDSSKAEWDEYFEAMVRAGYDPDGFERNIIEHVSGNPYEEWAGALR